jgi:preprotein translocase subunit SecE
MAKGQNIAEGGSGRRPAVAPRPAPRPAAAPAPLAAVKKRVGPVQFLREVRAEARKVTWTSWKETWITSVMVGIMVIFTAIFFFAVDWFLGMGIGALLKLANAE